MKNFSNLALVFFTLILCSCSKNLTYFTEDIYKDFRWSENELKQIQFYVSRDIHLESHRSNARSNIEEGSIKIESGSKVEKVVIEAGTPGIVVFTPNTDRFAVSFDEDPNNYLLFGPNEKAGGRYVLLAKDWNRNNGIITYGGKEYRTSSESAFAALMVDIKKARKVSYSKSKASGRTID